MSGENPTEQHSMKCPKLYGKDCTCDEYHTFEELYEHRITLYIALCKTLSGLYITPMSYDTNETKRFNIWRSEIHSDGSKLDGWFVLGIGKEKGKQITYHLPMSKWDKTDFARTLDMAPDFDGHTSDDVLNRIALI